MLKCVCRRESLRRETRPGDGWCAGCVRLWHSRRLRGPLHHLNGEITPRNSKGLPGLDTVGWACWLGGRPGGSSVRSVEQEDGSLDDFRCVALSFFRPGSSCLGFLSYGSGPVWWYRYELVMDIDGTRLDGKTPAAVGAISALGPGVLRDPDDCSHAWPSGPHERRPLHRARGSRQRSLQKSRHCNNCKVALRGRAWALEQVEEHLEQQLSHVRLPPDAVGQKACVPLSGTTILPHRRTDRRVL